MQLKIIKHIGIWLLASLLTLIVASKEGQVSWIVTYIWFGIGGIVGGSIGIIVLYLEMKYRSDFPENLKKTGRIIKLILLIAFSSYLFSIFKDGGFSSLRNSLGFVSWVVNAGRKVRH